MARPDVEDMEMETVNDHNGHSDHNDNNGTTTAMSDGSSNDGTVFAILTLYDSEGLKERHVSMIAFSVTVGVGLFLSSGKVIYLTGPGVAVVVYVLMAISLWCVNASLGEMSALFPVKGPIFEFPSRFLDEGAGFAVGWMAWFNFVVVVAAEITAVAELFNFQFDPNYLANVEYPEPTVEWTFGEQTNPAVWVFMFLIFIFLINLLPVRIFGEIEYVFGCFKLIFVVGLILFNVIVNARRGNPFEYYNEPYSFESQNFTANGQTFTGGPAHLASVWSAMTTAIFSLTGFETVAITAPENHDLAKNESIKLATRKMSLRVILLYTLAVFTVGLNVPYTDYYLQDSTINSIKSGEHSVFIVAAVRNHVTGWPLFFNGFFIFSATSCGLSTLYNASRVLHALASVRRIWPSWTIALNVRSMLERTIHGVPMAAVAVSWLFGLLAFLVVQHNPSETLGRLATNCTVSQLIVYIVICASYLRFYQCIDHAYKVGADPHQDRRAYNRKDYTRYPYKSHWQTFRAWYGLVSCSLLVLFNGWRSVMPPASAKDFIPSYISLAVFPVLVALYHMKAQGYNPLKWRIRASEELRKPLSIDQPNPRSRRGNLKWDGRNTSFKKNAETLGKWLWIWLK